MQNPSQWMQVIKKINSVMIRNNAIINNLEAG